MRLNLIKNRFSDFLIWLLGQEDTESIGVYPFVLYKSKKPLNKDVIAHELVHIIQAKREGTIKWLIKYIWFHLLYDYTRNPYEEEARKEFRKYRDQAVNFIIYSQCQSKK